VAAHHVCLESLDWGSHKGCPYEATRPPRSSMSAPLSNTTTQLVAARLGLSADRPPQILLALPKDDAFAQLLQDHFTHAGWSVRLAQDIHEALREPATSLVVLDAASPEAQPVLDQLKLNPATHPVPVIALFPRGHHPNRPPALRIQADLELIEPFQVYPFLEAVDRVLVRFAQTPAADPRRLHLILPSTQPDLDRACEIAATLFRATGLPEDQQASFLAAFREAVGNAIQHGNRRDQTKTVRIECHQDAAQITLSVRDEGEGFDFRPFLLQGAEGDAAEAARARHREGGQGGLGILMMVRSTDHIEYNERGNTVTFSKNLPPRPPET